MSIRRVTTPWIRYNAGNLTMADFTAAQEVEFTVRQGNYILKKYKDEIVYGVDSSGDGILGFQLTQEETKEFVPRDLVYLQVRLLTGTGNVRSSKTVHTRVKNVLSDTLLGVEES